MLLQSPTCDLLRLFEAIRAEKELSLTRSGHTKHAVTHLNAGIPELGDEFEFLLQQVFLSGRHHDLDFCGANLLC